MAKTYRELSEEIMEMVNALPMGCAFTDQSFKEMMEKWGLTEKDTDKIVSIGAGCFCLAKDKDLFVNTFKKVADMKLDFKKDDNNLIDMFEYELANHEYIFSHDREEVLDVCGYSIKDYMENKRVKKCFDIAIKNYYKDMEKLGY